MSTGTDQQKAQVVNAAIQEISHIATLPEITLKIIELVEDPSSTAQDLHKIISNDPALCSRILKVVNSSFYGLPGQIGSINRAIVMLGLNAVKNIAIAASLAKLFRGGELTPSFAARDLWLHSVGTAAATKVMGDTLGFALGDEAFLGGLIHDIGIMVEMQYDRNKLIEVIEGLNIDENGVPQGSFLEREQQIFGADHQEFGAALCEKWKFPANLKYVTGHHHDPMALPSENRNLAAMIYVAERLVAGINPDAFRLDLPTLDLDPAVVDLLKLTPKAVEDVTNRLENEIKAVENMLS
jgi:HD-like signal output (HDOD) protein